MAVINFKNSSSFWVATFFTLLLIFSISIILYFISLAYDADLIRQTETEINADIEIFQELDALGGQNNLKKILEKRTKNSSNKYFYNYSKTALNNINWPKMATTPKEGLIQFEENDITILAKVMTFEDGKQLLVGRNIAYIESTQNIVVFLGISIIVLLFIVSAVAYFISVYVVNLINTISHTADEIMYSGDLSQRIPLTHDRDDLSKLGKVLNKMFDRIEELVAGVRQVSDNIAHDLRTPLSRLKSKLEKFDGSDEEKKELIKEADGLINIFNTLLRIARIEAGKESANFKKVNLKALIEDVIDLYEPVIEEKKQTLKISLSDTKLNADRDMLFQAFANIIDNAIKFTPEKGKIEILSSTENKKVSIKVIDSGKGLSNDEREMIFTRFFRAESSRTTPGHGLGLSMVKAIIDAHNGEIKLQDNQPGLVFEVIL